ncbi:hypothetical protein sr07363 [Sporisorium reilianum SRZ2]|uniref:Uncharacterized protein n=1 Tax=Sporisorium reilianum (strain SRZ2) TaxID=999809 RepID=E6ZRA9_SPORE|nr:hypothetical protein sr07363 [Sporisorium reilianum SRZ2]
MQQQQPNVSLAASTASIDRKIIVLCGREASPPACTIAPGQRCRQLGACRSDVRLVGWSEKADSHSPWDPRMARCLCIDTRDGKHHVRPVPVLCTVSECSHPDMQPCVRVWSRKLGCELSHQRVSIVSWLVKQTSLRVQQIISMVALRSVPPARPLSSSASVQ